MGNTLTSGTISPVKGEGPAAGPTAPVLDVFESRQGEGICVGDSQVFIRFGGCNLVCDYCDTPDSIPAHSGTAMDLDDVLASVERVGGESGPKVVSLTGGEPLLQTGFLEELIPRLRANGAKIYLETNGTLPNALAKILNVCDWIAMDFKPESAVRRDLWEAHRWFLEMGGSKVFVKLVLTDKTTDEEFQRAVDLVALVRPETPLVLQPATPWGQAGSIPLGRLTSWWALATRQLKDVRIIPQIHRLWEIA